MWGPDLTDSPILRFWFLVPDDDSDEGQCCCLPAVHHTCGSSVSIGFFFGNDRDGDAAECTRKELSILMHLLSCCVVRLSCSGLSSCCLWRFSSFSIICLDFGLSMDNPPKAYHHTALDLVSSSPWLWGKLWLPSFWIKFSALRTFWMSIMAAMADSADSPPSEDVIVEWFSRTEMFW